MMKTKTTGKMAFPVEVEKIYITENSTVVDADNCLFFFERNDQLEEYLEECDKVCDMFEAALIAPWYKNIDRKDGNPAIVQKLEEESIV